MAQDVVLEARRRGRRPRYHRGAAITASTVARPEQCNLDQVGMEVRTLEALPTDLPRPWTQLCRRCWRGSVELLRADTTRDEIAAAAAARSAAQP